MRLVLPYPPSVNRAWRTFRGVQVRSPEAKAYRRAVETAAIVQRAGAPFTTAVALAVHLHPVEPKDAARRAAKLGPDWHREVRCLDLDNVLKVALDALQGIAYANDAQIVAIALRRDLPVPGGALAVTVEAA